jgi:hypothetical protein
MLKNWGQNLGPPPQSVNRKPRQRIRQRRPKRSIGRIDRVGCRRGNLIDASAAPLNPLVY